MKRLDREEKEILKTYNDNKLKKLNLSKKEIQTYKDAARATITKDNRVNIRLSSRDVKDLKVKALEEGMPYQTLMASILHKYLSGKLVEQES